MEWLKVEIRAEKEAAEAAAAILLEAGCQGAAFQSEGEMELIAGCLPYEEKMKDKVDRIAADIALFPKWGLGSAQLRTRVVRDEDWAESWKKFYRPVPIGAKLIICPSWEECPPGRVPVFLDPGMAFGTGHHPTTAMCLEEMERLILPGMIVYDVGCGSGILSLAAARLDAGRVLAGDVDPVAVRVCRENVLFNGLEEVIDVRQGSLEVLPKGANLILMNIIAPVIIALAPRAGELLYPGGSLVAAGISVTQGEETRRALLKAGLSITGERVQGEWVTITARK